MDRQGTHDAWDRITVEDLRAVGGAKWSRFPDLIGSFIAEMDVGVDPAIEQTIMAYATSGRHGYATAPWPHMMAEAYASFAHQRYGWAVDPALVQPLPDVLSGMESVIDTFTNPGEPVVVPTPAYMCFFSTLRDIGRPIIEVPSLPDQGWAMDIDGINQALSQGATSVVLCNPHNPTGRVYTRQELHALADVVAAHNAVVFNDEIHAPITLFGNQHLPYPMVSAQAAAHSVTATSPSKAWNLPGHRCAQLIFNHAEQLTAFTKSPSARFTDRVPNLGLFTNTTAYAHTPEWLPTLIPYLERNVRHLTQALEAGAWPGVHVGRHYQPPEGTFLVWINLADTPAAQDPAGYVATHAGVQATNGRACGRDWGTWLRLNVATPFPIWQTVVARIGDALSR